MKELEHHLQVACVNWFRYQHGKYKLHLFAIPNGSVRHIKVAMKLKKEGVTSGVSDLMLALPRGSFHGLFIEMKIKPNKPTVNQLKFGEAMKLSGYEFQVVYSLDQFIKTIEVYMKL